jgi:tetratricopeptide (TPR) repeat protein
MGRLPLALDAYEETIGHFPDDVVARNGRAEVLKEMGRLPLALDAYEETIGHFPDDVVAQTGRAEVLKKMGRLPLALDAYEETIGRFPGTVVARNGRAEVLKEMGRLPLALDAYEETIGRFPDDVFARTGRAEVLKEMGRLPLALDAYEETIGRFPDDVFARTGRAAVLLLMNRALEARASLPQTLPTTKEEWIGYHIVCMSYLREGDLDAAIERLRHGVEKVPWKSVRTSFDRALALALIRKHEFEAAAKLLEAEEALIVEAARSQVSLLLLAHSHAEMGRRAEALDNLMQITGSVSQDLRMLQSALMTQYDLGAPSPAQPSPKTPWLQADIEDREFRLVLAAA